MIKWMSYITTTLFLMLTITSSTANSAGLHKPKRGCIAHYKKWRAQKGAGAFAVSRDGNGCGWVTAQDDLATLRRLAVRNCAKAGKRCRVIQVRKGRAIASPWVPKKKCKSRYESWQYSIGNAAFATTKNGMACGWSKGQPSLKEAKKKALIVCRRHYAKCKVIKAK